MPLSVEVVQTATTGLDRVYLLGQLSERPEYTRIILGTAWKWKWQQQRADYLRRRTFDLIDINYVRLPRSTINFIDEIAPSNPLLRYSYEDHFIMRMGYTFSRTNRRLPSATVNALSVQPHVTSIRLSAEMAGNLLYGISNMIGGRNRRGYIRFSAYSMPNTSKARQTLHTPAISTAATRWRCTAAWESHTLMATRRWCLSKNDSTPVEQTEFAAGACAPSVRARTMPKIRLPTSSINAVTYASTRASNTAPNYSGARRSIICRCRQHMDHKGLPQPTRRAI